jgi:hypothetical protein
MAQLAEVQFPALWDAINGESGPETLCTARGTVLQSRRRCSPLSCFISSGDDQAARAPAVSGAETSNRCIQLAAHAYGPPRWILVSSWNPLTTLVSWCFLGHSNRKSNPCFRHQIVCLNLDGRKIAHVVIIFEGSPVSRRCPPREIRQLIVSGLRIVAFN